MSFDPVRVYATGCDALPQNIPAEPDVTFGVPMA